MIKVLFVCHGNICRSTMAESIFNYKINKLNIMDNFHVDSAATSREEIGSDIHYGTKNKLNSLNIPITPHRARQITKDDLDYYDYIIAMDNNNIINLTKMFGNYNKFYKLMYFVNSNKDIADPWYTHNFDDTFNDINYALDGFLKFLNI